MRTGRSCLTPSFLVVNFGEYKLIIRIAKISDAQGIAKVHIDCWAENEKLKDFYSKNGFEYLGDFAEEDYLISIFKFN
jgi:hypothetical protein